MTGSDGRISLGELREKTSANPLSRRSLPASYLAGNDCTHQEKHAPKRESLPVLHAVLQHRVVSSDGYAWGRR